jgi:transcriptional regulator with XRE-family HTH domain
MPEICSGIAAGTGGIMLTIPIIDTVMTGKNIIRLRDSRGFSVKDLQVAFGFTTPQAIYKWQNGTALPTVDNLVILAEMFDVKVDDILVVRH